MSDDRARRRGLGRGLSALMSDIEPAESAAPPRADRTLPIDALSPNPDQPRKRFVDAEIEELAASIKRHGILQPILVRAAEDGGYQIVAGERRWRAAQRARLHEVPVLIRQLDESDVLEIAIVENVQRTDLDPIEEAAGYRLLVERFGHTQDAIAEALGKSRSHVANLMRLLQLPEEVQRMVMDGVLTAGHARALITANDPAALAQEVARRGLTVRQAEALAKGGTPAQRGAARKGALKSADTLALEADLSAAMGTRVSVDHDARGGGKVVIAYDDLDALEGICAVLQRR